MVGVRYKEVPSIKVEACIKEAMEAMIGQKSFVLQVTGEKGEPAGWLDSLDLLRAFMEDPCTTGIREKSIRELVHSIVKEDYLNVDEELSCICSWVEKKSQYVPYFISKDGKAAGVLSMRGLLREAVECNDRERALRREA
ncbi:hypothetical protein MTAT_28760 [Moorella thermoacetica]|uniref:CBS domain-containing protein n=1 Tax=Neomoorella thermoacetica TaxID=1525 RepID=A0AAC9MVJ4_NEOTH|nr:hypothetical protein [Moorella thermoacetica]AOQ24482.1 hypothetical protein Maut_02047 [Moorella thermoacetica]TYL07492.1 hypothetical protein MTAT_28760 [Moorella thermoacetica]